MNFFQGMFCLNALVVAQQQNAVLDAIEVLEQSMRIWRSMFGVEVA